MWLGIASGTWLDLKRVRCPASSACEAPGLGCFVEICISLLRSWKSCCRIPGAASPILPARGERPEQERVTRPSGAKIKA
jgi:hypothetical protein